MNAQPTPPTVWALSVWREKSRSNDQTKLPVWFASVMSMGTASSGDAIRRAAVKSSKKAPSLRHAPTTWVASGAHCCRGIKRSSNTRPTEMAMLMADDDAATTHSEFKHDDVTPTRPPDAIELRRKAPTTTTKPTERFICLDGTPLAQHPNHASDVEYGVCGGCSGSIRGCTDRGCESRRLRRIGQSRTVADCETCGEPGVLRERIVA